MKEKEEGKNASLRRLPADESQGIEEDPSPIAAQPLDSLRSGYSWIRALEARHPDWHLQPVEGIPFTLPLRRLSESRVCLISLAGIYRKGQKPFSTSPGIIPPRLRAMRFKDRGDWSFREISLEAESTDLAVAHAHYDHSEADEDINCIFPLMRLVELEVEGFVGKCADVHYSLMGYVPEAALIVSTATGEIIPRLKKQEVDVAVVSGGCELSHQSGALIQREIEAAGIPTVGVSVCADITDRLRVPRAVTLRFPLGSPFGASLDAPMQLRVLRDALSLIDAVKTPGEIVCLPYDWIKT
jgi:D-proline reductase (dithiol) PrdB